MAYNIFERWPFTSFQNLNLDWLITAMKEAVEKSTNAEETAENLKQFVNTYFDNLDVQEEINNKIDSLVESGQIEDMVGAVAPAIVTAWLDANITPTTPVIDKTLSIDGAAADALKTGNIKWDLSTVKNELFHVNAFDGEWKQGAYSSSDGSFTTRTDYVCTINPINVAGAEAIKLDKISGNTAEYCAFWDSENHYLGNKLVQMVNGTAIINAANTPAFDNAAYMHISATPGYAVQISVNNAPILEVYVNHFGAKTASVYKNTFEAYGMPILNWQNYIYYFGQTGQKMPIDNRIGITEPIKARHNMTIGIDSTNYNFAVLFFSSEELGPENEIRVTSWTAEPVSIRAGDIILINMRKSDNAAISPEDGEHLTIDFESLGYNNYAIGSDMIRRPLRVTQLGTLKYYQSFCIYNGKFYSTNGANIAEQTSDFTVLRDVEAYVGHGNSMQLGSNGNAYISGWDDNIVYIVNLDSLAVTGTITLPVSAFQTTAIDDVHSIAYIFYRSTSPANVGEYELIVYDYANSTIINRKPLPIQFAAMQDLDLYEGRLIVLNGLATSASPNGYRIYDLNGNILANWIINQLGSLEPEGVAIDRNTGIAYVSDINARLYTVE